MEQTAAPPPLSAVTTDAVDSSPRYRNTTPLEETTSTPAPAPAKLRLMCSYGGHIVPRPHDKTLCYVGGDTRIVVVDRHVTLSDLTNRLTKTLLRSNSNAAPVTTSFTVKYQLPSEDLDSLISVTTDEDLENMIDEYERLNSNAINATSSARLRLFLFPTKPESVTSIGSLLESSTKSEDWFLSALNGTSSNFSDMSSVNCLLGLEDDVTVTEKAEKKDVVVKNSVQDVQSVLDSPMLETTSSFGSGSSLPSLQVKVSSEEQAKAGGGIEEQFVQMSVQQFVKHEQDVSFVPVQAPVVVAGVPVVSKVAVGAIGDNSNQQLQQQQFQQKVALGFDMTSPDSVSSDGSVTNPLSRRKPSVIYDQNPRIQIQDSAYVIPNSATATQVDQQHPQIHHQPQFIHTAVPPPQYLHHHHPSGAVPMASYYQMYPSQSQVRAPHPALDQQNFVYYMPSRQPPQGYNLPLQADPAASAPPSNQVPPPSGLFTAPRPVQTTAKTESPAGVYRTATSSGALPPQLVQVPSSHHQIQPQYVGYSHIPQSSQPVVSGGSGGGGNYVYEFTDPSQQGQHIYYAAQPLPPQSAAQYQTMTTTLPAETQAGSHLQADNSMKQQVRTSQP